MSAWMLVVNYVITFLGGISMGMILFILFKMTWNKISDWLFYTIIGIQVICYGMLFAGVATLGGIELWIK